MTILPSFAKLNTREFEKIWHSRNFVPAKFNTCKVFCNIFSCRSKVLGGLRPKSDLLRIYTVRGIQPIRGNSEKRRNLLKR